MPESDMERKSIHLKNYILQQQRENVMKCVVEKACDEIEKPPPPPTHTSSWVSDGEMTPSIECLPCKHENLAQPFTCEDLGQPFTHMLISWVKNSLLPEGRALNFIVLNSIRLLVMYQFTSHVLVTFLVAMMKYLVTTKEEGREGFISAPPLRVQFTMAEKAWGQRLRSSQLVDINHRGWSVKPCIPE